MKQFSMALFLISYLYLCWLWMMYLHESGHVVAALLTGGRIARVVIDPWRFSYTELIHNPRPLVVTWAGLVVGSVVPVLVWYFWHWGRLPGEPLIRFFVGFCLVANGTYWAGGSLVEAGDAADAVRLGTPRWMCLLTGGVAAVAGLGFWHTLGPRFCRLTRTATLRMAVVMCLLVGATILGALLVGGTTLDMGR
ncbi:MAG: hypothetical protein KatS3mg110_3286 [Pirellulaceae bacterium]|nr:MAG: hypothetical protein KatS3mg110_3286 [Pirellulaceae bacterium]